MVYYEPIMPVEVAKPVARDYTASREHARILRAEFGKRSEVYADHPNPANGKTCRGPLIISYSSFRSPLVQEALDFLGEIPSTCLSCGVSAYIGPDKKLVNSSII